MGYIPTKPSPTEDTRSTVFQEVDRTTHQRRFELHHRVPKEGHDVGAARKGHGGSRFNLNPNWRVINGYQTGM